MYICNFKCTFFVYLPCDIGHYCYVNLQWEVKFLALIIPLYDATFIIHLNNHLEGPTCTISCNLGSHFAHMALHFAIPTCHSFIDWYAYRNLITFPQSNKTKI